LAQTVASTLGGSVESLPMLTPTTGPSSCPASRYVPSTQRIMSELALAQTVELEDAIQRTALYSSLP